MRLDNERESDNVEDMRGASYGGGGGFGLGGRSIGIGGIVIALIAYFVFGVDPGAILGGMSGGGAPPSAPVRQGPAPRPPSDDPVAHRTSQILAKTEDTWGAIFSAAGRTYEQPKLTLFSGAYPTACGMGQSAMGPFYCPQDHKVYIDLKFFNLMKERFHAAGDFAQAYVIAHEVGHHVQTLLGISEQLEARRSRASRAEGNAMSVRLELQADCFAGVWAKRSNDAKSFLDPGDFESALNAAAAIGDDTLQRETQGQVVPDSFTHGSSAQRVRWLKRGFETGDVQACDTFRATQL
jgi:predicted metalloprotease